MEHINLFKPNKESLGVYLFLGAALVSLSIYDLVSNSFFSYNITSFLPNFLSFFTPLLFGFLGLHFIRIEFSGYKTLDLINKNINLNWFN